jgi:hypothetical protein
MSIEGVLRKVVMLPAYAIVAVMAIREKLRHATRKRIGDSTKRGGCCAPLPEAYPLGKRPEEIPDLATKLELVSTINTGYTRWFGCRVCGQEWREDEEGGGNYGGYPHVKKAT